MSYGTDGFDRLKTTIAEAGHLLPEQAPLHAFVHHNTLHCFESLPFEDAVVAGSKLYGTEPFQTEAAFGEALRAGRILDRDLEAIAAEWKEPSIDEPVFDGALTRREFRRMRLRHAVEIPTGHELKWLLRETDVLRRLHADVSPTRRRQLLAAEQAHSMAAAEARIAERLWEALCCASPSRRLVNRSPTRTRDALLRAYGIDTDRVTHPLLIRTAAVFLDQGVAYWTMPRREEGYLVAFRELYRLTAPPLDRLLTGLSQELSRQAALLWSAEQTIEWALNELTMRQAHWPSVIRDTLLSLRGWAGMMRQLELHPERAPVQSVPAKLADYLAVQLTLDVITARNVLRRELGREAMPEDFRRVQPEFEAASPTDEPNSQLPYEAFVLAQLLPIDVALLDDREQARRWLDEVNAFDGLARRRQWHLAYERRHRVEVLDGLIADGRSERRPSTSPSFQAVFCIDEREESLRRHLEERHPGVETFGFAGFFGVAMQYRGLDDVRPRPLCPVAIHPRHLVVERAIDEHQEHAYRRTRRRRGAFTHSYAVASKTLVRGGGVTALLGLAAAVPLTLRSLSPRIGEAWAHWAGHVGVSRPATRLQIENTDGGQSDGLQHGFTIDEMAAVVRGALQTMSMSQFCPIVVIVGHGSSSLNNPHEAAHDCGATGGGRGGPNARAFAAMANHSEVRRALAADGLELPESTHFVGAYHNTCDDSMTYYDLDLLPESLVTQFEHVRRAFADACRWDAHERTRKFETTSTNLPLSRAIDVAETHANDLGEPRPEYGHATNAVCIVGRRARTRGLFLDRRAFLVSYDPTRDTTGRTLEALLLSVGPVGAGINLEYYFSYVDPAGYGCGTKLPHNITGLIGVMDGHASDLRTGLPWQMVEIHEPVRLLTIVEARPELLTRLMSRQPALGRLVGNGWIQLVAWNPDSDAMSVFTNGEFRTYVPETLDAPIFPSSVDYYRHKRGGLPPVRVAAP